MALRRASAGIALLTSVLYCTLIVTHVHAQHAPREFEALVAQSGQATLVDNAGHRGFFTSPFIGRFQGQVLTNGVQSLSVFLESVNETRTYQDLFQLYPRSPVVDASFSETMHMSTLGLEVLRTLVVSGSFRMTAGLDLGFGLGTPGEDIRPSDRDTIVHRTSQSTWDGLYASALIRTRLSVFKTGTIDWAIVGVGRYWGFITIGPLGEVTDIYNGPAFRSMHEIGYLAGISACF